MFFKFLVSAIYCIIEKYVCPYYLYLQQEKLSVQIMSFQISTFDDISGIGIPQVSIDIVYFHGFTQ